MSHSPDPTTRPSLNHRFMGKISNCYYVTILRFGLFLSEGQITRANTQGQEIVNVKLSFSTWPMELVPLLYDTMQHL